MAVEVISSFTGQYSFLSNFYTSPIEFDGRTFSTLEHAYQSAKTNLDHEKFMVWGQLTPGKAKALGRRVTLRPDWEKVKMGVMRRLIAQKFAPRTELAAKLLATGDALLIEGNHWNDQFWGACKSNEGLWVGENRLGILLQVHRDILRWSPT